MTDTTPSPEQLAAVLAGLQALDEHRRYNKMLYFEPCPKQHLMLSLGATKRERLFMAGNRLGKSETGAMEAACHATGRYPEWWQGKMFKHPTIGWVAGTTGLDVRNVAQTKLCGQYGQEAAIGTGFIPRECMGKTTLARGVTDAYDTVQVIHSTPGVKKGTYIKTPVNDGVSLIGFKSYEQGRQKFQGETLDWGWADEEPPSDKENDVYTEFVTRVRPANRCFFITFTPMEGETPLTDKFTREVSKDREIVRLALMDPEVIWYTDEEKRVMLEGYPKWQRGARAQGIPLLGSGAVFPYAEETLSEPKIATVPPQFKLLWAVDFGLSEEHPFAAVLLAWDLDTDCIHVLHSIRLNGQQPINHAAAMRAVCADAPVAWPHDGTQRVAGEAGAAQTLASLYKKFGLKMLHGHATFREGGYSTEAGILEIEQRITTSRFKVASHLSEWWEEYRSYHRKAGLIVKARDDLMSATRIGVMAIRHARAVPMGASFVVVGPTGKAIGSSGSLAKGLDFDVFGA